jgi:hypothetical protein
MPRPRILGNGRIITIYLDDLCIEQLRELAKRKGASISSIVRDIILDYLGKNKQLSNNDEKSNKEGPPLPKTGKHTHTNRKVRMDLDNIKQQILHIVLPGGSLSKKLLEYIIMSVSNVYDKRSVEARIRALIADGFIKPEGPNGGSSPIYRIIGPNNGN